MKNIEIKIKADGFIIPNSISSLSEYGLKRPQYKLICELNNIQFTENTKFVQIWLTNDENDNIGSSGIRGTDINAGDVQELIPAELFLGKKEGDIIDVSIPLRRNYEYSAGNVLQVELKLNQKSYRYRSFGKFEDVFNRLYN